MCQEEIATGNLEL
ncbi:unnamed protein product [Rhodiola kirilowii]